MKTENKGATPRISITVTTEQVRYRADRALSALVPGIGRRASKIFFHKGAILLNGLTAEGSEKVDAGDTLEYPDPNATENRDLFHKTVAPRLTTPHGLHIPRVYEDDHLIVIAKPSEIPVHKGQGGFTKRDTIEDVLTRAYPPTPHDEKPVPSKTPVDSDENADSKFTSPKPTPGFFLVHRLDQETSGCLMVAKNEDTLRAMVQQFSERKIKKEYWALVAGEVPWRERIVSRPIKYERSNEMKNKRTNKAPNWVDLRRTPKFMKGVKKGIGLEEGATEGKACETYFRVQERFKGYTLLHCEPHTGRTHQIRVHLVAEGYPLAYDALYGRTSPLRLGEINPATTDRKSGEEIVLNRQPLHASRISFLHPHQKDRVKAFAPLPKDLRELLHLLKKFRKK